MWLKISSGRSDKLAVSSETVKNSSGRKQSMKERGAPSIWSNGRHDSMPVWCSALADENPKTFNLDLACPRETLSRVQILAMLDHSRVISEAQVI